MEKLKCVVCEHEWIPRMDNPLMCPRCKSYDYAEGKTKRRSEQKENRK